MYVHPQNTASISNAMIAVYKSPELRNSLILNARIQRQKFSWEKTADLLWESIEKGLEGK
jgi:glycosyltransferase involved in cell wall biosynthesis